MQNSAGYLSHQIRRDSSPFPVSILRQNTVRLRSGMWNISAAKFSTSIILAICFFYLLATDVSGNSPELTLEEYAKQPFGNVVFLRHAFAPGMDANGKPAKFKIDDCSTQRNLDSTGIKQATIIGKKFSQNGIKFEIIYSSQWCRCLETAQLLKLGEVYPEVSLNAGFKGLFNQVETLAKLRKNLESLKYDQKLVLMITHRGVISAITGVNVKSGGAVAYNIKSKTSKIILIE
ncbi:MAG: histidine phosphatase family protein [Proteobacteria bacterium]|nr:histidine phosphatase family protein [Pseudomonadota bacterium]